MGECTGLPREHSLADCYQPTQQDAMFAGPADHPLHSLTLLPAVPPLKVKGWGWVYRDEGGKTVDDFVESLWGQCVVLHA